MKKHSYNLWCAFRRGLVPGGVRLDKFHLVLQAATGWTNSHVHNVEVAHLTYAVDRKLTLTTT